MHWLGALVAFAATMLIFAIFVSTLVELLHRVLRLRAKGLRLMLESFFIDVLDEKFQLVTHTPAERKGVEAKQAIAIAGKTGDSESTATKLQHAGNFATQVMNNPVVPMSRSNRGGGIVSLFLDRFLDASVVNRVPVEVFTERLAESAFVKDLDQITDEVLLDIAQKYELYGARASEYFERRARLLSVLVALVVATAFYVNPYHIMVHYLQTPDRVDAAVAQASGIYAASPMSVTVDVATIGESLPAVLDELAKRIDELQGEVAKPESTGVVGWQILSEDSVCAEPWSFTSDICRHTFLSIENVPRPGVIHILWIFLGGLLIGLGAPFWARVLSSVSATRDITHSLARVVGYPVEVRNHSPFMGSAATAGTTQRALSARQVNDVIQAPLALATFRAARRVRE